jgi:hypothetical protein
MPDQDESRLKKAARTLARADLFSWALLWLMVLLVLGTLAEKNVGLYLAEQLYFSAWIIWLGGFLPMPGVLPTVGYIFLGLCAKLAIEPWKRAQAGTVIVHVGVLLLLLGAFVTAHFSTGGNIVIAQGDSQAYYEDDHAVELAVTNLSTHQEAIFGEDSLRGGAALKGDLPFTLDVVSWCRNCGLARLPAPRTEGNPRGVAINFDLRPLPRDKVEEKNKAGVTFRLRGAGDKNGLYAVFEFMPIPEIVAIDGVKYLIAVRHVRHALPFSVRLVAFKQEFYPGTDKARGYQSEVVLDDHSVEWHSLIRMNEPLRYKGYTLYQASFMEGGPQAVSVLAVVKNMGRLFPYISSIVICIGMLINLCQRLPKLNGGRA